MEKNDIKILIADDEPDIVEIIGFNLMKEGFNVITAKNGIDALEQAKIHKPHLIILDIMMPYKTGIEVCEILRSQPDYSNTLIILLTALNDDATQIKGLKTGADDYVNKPISPKVLVSRVQALLRRTKKANTQIIEWNNIKIDSEKFLVYIDDKEISLAKKEFELLHLLASQPGRVFLRNEILDNVWGSDVIVGDRTIDVHIRKIRKKLKLDCITTIKGVGYKFE
jgi:two-component system alkaline phosphatase synthesis response regulator PhoP